MINYYRNMWQKRSVELKDIPQERQIKYGKTVCDYKPEKKKNA
jgi:hypothetical protein